MTSIPDSYSQLARLQKHGKVPRAAGPCQVCRREPPCYESGASRFTYDHCHEHDFVRGVLCRNCNSALMKRVDARWEDAPSDVLWPALLENWNRCPQCAAEGWRALYRRDEVAGCAWSTAWQDAQRANPAMTNAELREVAARAARAASPGTVLVYGFAWGLPIVS